MGGGGEGGGEGCGGEGGDGGGKVGRRKRVGTYYPTDIQRIIINSTTADKSTS